MRLPVDVVRRARREIATARALLLQLEVPAPAVQEAIDLARAAHVEVFLNAAPIVAGTARLCAGADVLIVNESEAEELSGRAVGTRHDQAARAARELHELGPPTVVITLGERGALLSRGEETLFVPGFRVLAVDPTGAGDAFCAGLVCARCAGAAWPAAVELANACGALAATAVGATAGLRGRAGVEALVSDGTRWVDPA
jgi:ribokinase